MASIVRRFESICDTHADLPAVKTRDRTLSYSELNADANRLARRILDVAGEGDGTVGLLLEHGISLSLGALACLKANRVYVPLDLNNPTDRQERILKDAETDVLLTDGTSAFSSPNRLSIDINTTPLQLDDTNLHLDQRPDDYAFLLYTSGSTGEPKGVIYNHDSVVVRIADANRFGVGRGDRLTALGPGGMNLFRALLTGATLVSLNLRHVEINALADWLRRERITIYHSVPTLFRHFVSTLSDQEVFPDLRIVNMTGETLLSNDVAAFRHHFSEHCILVNGLGTTEAGTFSELRIDHDTPLAEGVVGVGQAVEGTELVLLNSQEQVYDDTGVGEIVVCSEHLSPGYWNRPESMKGKFIQVNGRRAYRTGDLGKWQSGGNLIHLGRIDHQVKIRGHRVEVGEVEVAMLKHPSIQEAAVVGRRDENGGGPRLFGYTVLAPGCQTGESEMQAFLRERLPEFMVPVRIIFLPALPQTPNGKVDRKALPVPELAKPEAVLAPSSSQLVDVMHTMLMIWQETLRAETIRPDDNFFELGGDSITAMQILNRIYTTFDVEQSIKVIFDNPSVILLSEVVLRERSGDGR